MQKFNNFLSQIDIFGVPIRLLTNQSEYLYTSRYGGMLSIILVCTGLTYFFYIISLWISGDIAPKVSIQQQTTSYSEFNWTDPLIQFTIYGQEKLIDPFRKVNNIITPMLFKVTDTSILEEPQMLFSDDQTNNSVKLNNGSIVLNNAYQESSQYRKMQQYMLTFSICDSKYMQDGSSCASEDEIQEFLEQYNGFLFLTIKLTQLNYYTRKFEAIYKQSYQAFSPTQQIYSQILLKQQQTIIDDGILFTNFHTYDSINNYDTINQQVDSKYLANTIKALSLGKFSVSPFAAFLLRIDNISMIENVVMPKLGEILAQIGSIVQLIFILKHLAFYLNNQFLKNEVLHDIVTMYIPKYKNVVIKRNILGQIKKIEDKENEISEEYFSFVKRALQKCKLSNILSEISKLQFILEKHIGEENFQSYYQLGYKSPRSWTEFEVGKDRCSGKIQIRNNNEESQRHSIKIHPLDFLINQDQ